VIQKKENEYPSNRTDHSSPVPGRDKQSAALFMDPLFNLS
jgi:hypothetical protein